MAWGLIRFNLRQTRSWRRTGPPSAGLPAGVWAAKLRLRTSRRDYTVVVQDAKMEILVHSLYLAGFVRRTRRL